MCEPVKKLKRCKYFRDITWTLVTYPGDNSTQQLVHCRCPKNSEAYLIKRHEFQTSGGTGYQYSFACSPQTVRDLNASLVLAQTWKRFGQFTWDFLNIRQYNLVPDNNFLWSKQNIIFTSAPLPALSVLIKVIAKLTKNFTCIEPSNCHKDFFI